MYLPLLSVVLLISTAAADAVENVTLDIVPSAELFPALPLGIPNSQTEQCKHDSLLYLRNIVNSSTWAYQMWDSSARQPNGQLNTVGYNFGNYKECLAVLEPFKTQYCLVFVEINITPTKDLGTDPFYRDPFDVVTNALHFKGGEFIHHRDQPKFGLCIPSSCDYDEFEKYLNSYLAQKVNEGTLNITYTARIPTGGCQTNRDDEHLGPGGIAFMCTIACLGFLVIICSLIDWWRHETITTSISGPFSWLVTAFSVRNTHTVLVSNSKEHSELRSIHGLRFCCVLSILFGHITGLEFVGPMNDINPFEKLNLNYIGRLVCHIELQVDTFLVLSGILLMYAFLTQSEKRPINPILLIVLRYIRLTPAYLLILWYYCSVFYSSGDGPLWKIFIENEVEMCRKYWWLNMLYIHNEVLTHSMCLIHTWYMSCDTQLFIVGAFLCSLVYKRPKLGLSITGVLIILIIPIRYYISYSNDIDGIVRYTQRFVQNPREDTLFRTMYTNSYTRGGAFFIGMLTGYLIFKWKKNGKARLPNRTMLKYGLLCFIILIADYVSVCSVYNLPYPYNVIIGSLYSSLDRSLWAVGIAILIVILGFGNIPIISTFLNWPVFVPLGKLSMVVYLTHFLIIQHLCASQKAPLDLSCFDFFSIVWAITVWSYLIALLVFYTVDAPLKIMIEHFMKIKTHIKEYDDNIAKNSNEKTWDHGSFKSTTKF